MSTAADPTGRCGQSAELPTHRGGQTRAAIDMAAHAVIARKGILATTMVNDDVAQDWAEISPIPIAFIADAVRRPDVHPNPANIYYRVIYSEEGG